ncbi:hypothetical protein AYX13_04727 [Cryptococcus neoformans]|nr:hypothetical protein AYX13_04727 [Cryptococcus neoformans var. grubii]
MASKSSSIHPYSPLAHPRRRTSLSVALSSHPFQPAYPYPYPYHRRRARTMPIQRTRRSRDTSTSRTRKTVIIFLVILSLILLGTVIVLSTVSYYLAIPSWAYLTETEVAWRPEDVIKPLLEQPRPKLSKRVQWRELDSDVPAYTSTGTATASIISVDSATMTAETWDEFKEEMEELDAAEEVDEDIFTKPESEAVDTLPTATSSIEEDNGQWGIDGMGTGSYWMRNDWDGRVRDTDSWERLYNVTNRPGETIPRLIHQTWKDDQLPEKWRKAWKECREGMPDYEYMLWTDDLSREFIAKHYPSHLRMYDSYEFPIQRADSIRYFILHHFGGVYMDLDIGCRRRLDPLLQGDWEVILPITKPVGISNDLIFSSKGSAFMDGAVHSLAAFNHKYFSNYPTVMFSTGPMFLSAQYAIFSASHPLTESHPRSEIRVLPKSLYGKNAPISDVPHSFFSHFYGSSWHADDAGFITFLGNWGKRLMWIGGVILIFGAIRLIWVKRKAAAGQQYQLLSILPITRSPSPSGYDTPTSAGSSPLSPSALDVNLPPNMPSDITSVFRRAGNLILAAPATLLQGGDRERRGRRRQGLLYFVPAIFQPVPAASEASQFPLRRSRRDRDNRKDSLAPPPYEQLMEEGSASGSACPSPSRPSNRLKSVEGGMGEATMEDVDAFLNEADNEDSGFWTRGGRR